MNRKVFIDTNPLIYLVSEREPYFGKVLQYMTDRINDDSEFYTSTITDAEFLTKPIADGDLNLIGKYKTYLDRLDFIKCEITEQIAEKAALIRAKYKNIKLADALQLATSLECHCDFFLTNDKQLKQVQEITVVYLNDL